MIVNILILIIGFFALIKGADVLVRGASALAKRFNIPEIIIGLTVVACGTSAPEAAISISSVINGVESVGVGNILGSNIANILLILGVCAIISNLCVKRNTVLYEIPFVIFISMLLMFIGWQYGIISNVAAFGLCFLFILFLLYLFWVGKNNPDENPSIENMSFLKMMFFIATGIAALIIGAKMTVNSSVNIAHALNISERIIGLTLVAFGTSLPELFTSVVATIKKHSDMAIGNVVGSNIFNILFILGITGLIQPIPFDYAFLIDAAWGIIAAVLLFLFIFRDAKLGKFNGAIFLTLYAIYIMSLIK